MKNFNILFFILLLPFFTSCNMKSKSGIAIDVKDATHASTQVISENDSSSLVFDTESAAASIENCQNEHNMQDGDTLDKWYESISSAGGKMIKLDTMSNGDVYQHMVKIIGNINTPAPKSGY